MTETIYRRTRVLVNKDKTITASVEYKIGEMKSSIAISMSAMADGKTIEVVDTFDKAMTVINKHWEQTKVDAVDKIIDKELKEKQLVG